MLNYKNQLLRSIIIAAGFIVFFIAALFYESRYSKNVIYKRVLKQDGYNVYEIEKPIHFTAFIEPDWIPAKENEEIKLNKEIGKVGNVKIVIESVMNRGDFGQDIYFNFDAIPYLTYEEGEFLYNSTFNDDGTNTSYSNFTGYHLYGKDKTDIEVGQRGIGPGSKISFGVDMEYYDLITEGFYFEYNSSILYGYTLKN